MSENTFRRILVVVVIMWAILVLVPSALDFIPRTWTALQYFLPGSAPTVTVYVKDARSDEAIRAVRVQIVLPQATLTAVTNEKGEAVFESVPAGDARAVQAQKIDYTVAAAAQPIIPRRQRARFTLALNQDPGKRLYIAHDYQAGSRGITLLDVASRLPMTPPGETAFWDRLDVDAMLLSPDGGRLYVLTPESLLVVDTSNSFVLREIKVAAGASMALSPRGQMLYLYSRPNSARAARLQVLATDSLAVSATVEVGANTKDARFASSPDGRRLYFAPPNSSTLLVLDGSYLTRLGVINTAAPIVDVVVASDGRFLYLLLKGLPSPFALELPASGGRFGAPTAGAGARSGLYPVLGAKTDDALPGAALLRYGETLTNRWLYMINPDRNRLIMVDAQRADVESMTVGRLPVAMAGLGGGDMLYVANRDDNTVAVVSLTNRVVMDAVPVRSKPALLAIH